MATRRNVLVTGAASGIGERLAGTLAASGDWVLGTDLNEEGLEESAAEWSSSSIETATLDVTRPDDWRSAVDRMVEERGGIDLLVHAAGIYAPGRVDEIEPDAIHAQVDVNLKGTMFGTRFVGAAMAEGAGGHIVNFGSLASLAPMPGFGVYAGTKFGVRGFSLAAAEELRSEGVDVTVVMPDAVDTSLLEKVAASDHTEIGFSGTVLGVEDVEEVVLERVLPDRPLEVVIPRDRGLLAKIGNFAPGLTRLLRPVLELIGESHRESYRDA